MSRAPERPPLVSLRKRFLRLLAGVIALFVAGMALSLAFSVRTNEAATERLLSVEAAQARANVLRRWDFYRQVAANLARDPQLLDLMLVGSTAEKERWAVSRQYVLPNILGLAIVSPEGEVYGDATLLRVGPGCQRDLRDPRALGSTRGLVHRDVPGLEHVDLTAPIRDTGGEILGHVFLSVRLADFQRIVDESAQPGHALALLDASGQPLVSSGSLASGRREARAALPPLGWTLVVQSPVAWLTSHSRLQLLAGGLTLAAVLALLVVMTLRIRRPVVKEVEAALHALAGLTRNESASPVTTRYAEFAPVAADINRIAQQLHDQREKLAHLSLTDSLTDLPNRRAFERRFLLAQGLAERDHPVALVMLDIDYFKGVNDRHGHGVGDQVLLALAQSLKELTRRADLAARLAGDEFVVLLTGLDASGVEAWYERLSRRFSDEIATFGLDLRTGLSAGQTWLGAPGDNVQQALARADQALYRAKALGRGRLVQDALPSSQDGAR